MNRARRGAGQQPGALPVLVLVTLLAGGAELQVQACPTLELDQTKTPVSTPGAVQGLQQVVATAYPADSIVVEAAGGFVDGRVGSQTVALTQRLCQALGRDREPGEVGAMMLAGALPLGEVMTAFPDWQTRVSTPGFATWAAGALNRVVEHKVFELRPGPEYWTELALQVDGAESQVLGRQSWLERRICGFACPNRWELRGILFGFLLLWGAAWMLSNWVPRIRRGLERPWFVAFKVFLLLTFVTSLWCDPYWGERRPLILLLFLGGLLLSSLLAWFRKHSEAEYP